MYIPRGRYLTIEQYQQRIGVSTKAIIHKAIREGRLTGCIWLDERTVVIPEDAIIINKTIRSGKYIGLSAWLKGNIVDVKELDNWEMKQRQLRKMREGDIADKEECEYDSY